MGIKQMIVNKTSFIIAMYWIFAAEYQLFAKTFLFIKFLSIFAMW
jgi:hypothetical protein